MPLNAAPHLPPVEEVLHGVVVRDRYRWLEDRSLPETEHWIREQQRRCHEYFDKCLDLDALHLRVQAYLDVEVVDQPVKIAGLYFYRRRDKGQEQPCLYVRDIDTGNEQLLVDSSADGKFTSVGIHQISADGSLLAYEVKRGGGDSKEIHVLDVRSGSIYPDHLPLGYGRGFAFTADLDGFFYSHETPEAAAQHTIRLHRFGHSGEDAVVFRVPRMAGSRLLLTANAARLGAVWLSPQGSGMIVDFSITALTAPTQWIQLFSEKRLPYNPILWRDRIVVLTETASRSSKLIELDLTGQEIRTLIPERKVPIRQLAITRDRIYASYLDHGVSTIHSWDDNGRDLGAILLPAGGTVQLLPHSSQASDSVFYTYESFGSPLSIFEYAPEWGDSRLWHQRGGSAIADRCHVRDAAFASKDGTRIPITLVSLDGTPSPRPSPVIMTGYGGYGVTMTPQFSVLVAIMMELGVTFALPQIRGGGEFGKAWHDAGRGRSRQQAFDDFIGAAEWLCREGVTTPRQLAIFGGSNSGLLVGVAMTQRPDLFAAVLCMAPLLDMVRYEYFDQAVKWRHEYGTADDPEDFRTLYAYSPYHHVKEGVDYPPTLLVSGDKDDRCNPAHVRKMAALLQEREPQKAPILVDYSEERGHSPVLPLSVRVPALARRIAFFCKELNIALPVGGFR
jgi:prolyl oligopeptidase